MPNTATTTDAQRGMERRRRMVPCEGSQRMALARVGADRGLCYVCALIFLTYDSSRHGRGLMVDHQRAANASGGG